MRGTEQLNIDSNIGQDFYLEVSLRGGISTAYTLTINQYTCQADSKEPNNDRSTAKEIQINNGQVNINVDGLVGCLFDEDWFYFLKTSFGQQTGNKARMIRATIEYDSNLADMMIRYGERRVKRRTR